MKKKYYIVLISFACLLIASMIIIGVLSSKLMDKKESEAYYEIQDEKILTINEITNVKLELLAYNYSSNNTQFIKTYEYKCENSQLVLTQYIEYLVNDENFVDNSTYQDNTSSSGDFSLTKTYEDNDDELVVTITYTNSIINLVLTYSNVN